MIKPRITHEGGVWIVRQDGRVRGAYKTLPRATAHAARLLHGPTRRRLDNDIARIKNALERMEQNQ